MCRLIFARVVVDAFFLIQLPLHESRLLLYIVENLYFADEVGYLADLLHKCIYFDFEIVIHIFMNIVAELWRHNPPLFYNCAKIQII